MSLWNTIYIYRISTLEKALDGLLWKLIGVKSKWENKIWNFYVAKGFNPNVLKEDITSGIRAWSYHPVGWISKQWLAYKNKKLSSKTYGRNEAQEFSKGKVYEILFPMQRYYIKSTLT